MIRNILYSLFLHSILAALIYLNFNFQEYQENDSKSKITVSFVAKVGNTESSISEKAVETSNKLPDEQKPVANKKIVKSKQKAIKKEVKKIVKSIPKSRIKSAPVIKNIDRLESKSDDFKFSEETTKKQQEVNFSENQDNLKDLEKESLQTKEEINKEQLDKTKTEKEYEEEVSQDSKEEKDDNASSGPSKKLEGLDLSFREKLNIESQIKRCYKKAIEESGKDSKLAISLHIIIEKDGSIDPDLIVIENFERYKNPKEVDFHVAFDNARLALSICSPLRNLPDDKYDIWREVDLQFDENMK